MLQRPRPILIAHDSQPAASTNFYHHHYHNYQYNHHNIIGAETLLVRNCRINSFNSLDHSWNAAKAKLVARWEKTVLNRRLHRLKRSMVKESRTCIHQPQLPEPTNAGVTAKYARAVKNNKAATQGSERCLAELSVRKEEPNTQNDGHKLREISVDPMESNGRASAARRPSHCQRDQKGDRGLTPDQFAARKKQEAVAIVMAAFNKWFDKRLQIISYAYEASEASENSGCGPSGGGDAGDGASGTGGSGSPARTKRRLDGDNQDDPSGGGDEHDPDRGGSKRAKKDVEPERKWACPFYKHDPRKYSKHRSCTGPGWPSLHRLKEHLYRIHREPKHPCVRCNRPFEDKKDLDDHLRADVRCEKKELAPLQGIDPATETKLKVRKKPRPGVTDEQRWREIYLILFPDANPNALPSPYYDGRDSLGFSKDAQDWSTLEKRMRKVLPGLVQKKVERSFEKLEGEVLERLPQIIRDGLFEFWKMPHDDSSPTVTPAATPRAVTTPRAATPGLPMAKDQSGLPMDEGQDASLDLSDLFEPDMPFPFGGFIFNESDFTAQLGLTNAAECHNYDEQSDSGYASTSTARDGPLGLAI
ncbi:hypothetical protein F4779DRAFT_632307 [Xylariaceae sp. FL0662B]|nr:hypothetical protein F4779DRAFT_632307 [Xylariaceae sp. FL0662B]